jgi:hypothetical protein
MQRQIVLRFLHLCAVLVAVCAGAVFYFWQTKQTPCAQLKERAAVAEADLAWRWRPLRKARGCAS